MEKNEKPDCYKCEWRGKVCGSAHSSCNHPFIKKATDDPLGNIMSTFASVGRVPPVSVDTKELNIQAEEYGVKNGWFNSDCGADYILLRWAVLADAVGV